jgi:TrmH family RNA methyltransferase
LFLDKCKQNKIKIIGADAKGKSIYTFQFNIPMLLVMGSESHGIDEECKKYIEEYVSVPGKQTAESLNVAIATGIICSEIMRSTF